MWGLCCYQRPPSEGQRSGGIEFKHQWMQNNLVGPWLNHQFSKFSFWWNPPELRSTEQNRTEQIGSTQIPWRACQITAGTPHREETLDPLPQVDNALLWIFNYGASKATKKRNKCKKKKEKGSKSHLRIRVWNVIQVRFRTGSVLISIITNNFINIDLTFIK